MIRRNLLQIGLSLFMVIFVSAVVLGSEITSIFYVFGTMYEDDGVTVVDDDYSITVTNFTKDLSSSLTLGE